jgi:hypothetical protein
MMCDLCPVLQVEINILQPSAVEGLPVDVLRVPGQMILNREWQIGIHQVRGEEEQMWRPDKSC